MDTPAYAADVTAAYIAAAYFTDTGDSEQPGSDAPLAQESRTQAAADVASYMEHPLVEGALRAGFLTPEQIGHDIWLTRNGHGTGFWDRGMGRLGDWLSERACALGECTLYQGDDGFLYFG